jgi:hypothetical protein
MVFEAVGRQTKPFKLSVHVVASRAVKQQWTKGLNDLCRIEAMNAHRLKPEVRPQKYRVGHETEPIVETEATSIAI